MDTIVNISQFLLSLSLLIILHEMGHFLPAKAFKTRVEKFYLFFDFAPFNSLWKIQKGETEYGIGWLPLGGYVKIAGMVDESMDTEALQQEPQPWEFRSKPAWQRLIIMLGGVTVNFILGFFLFAMILFAFGRAYVPTDSLSYGLAYDSILIKNGFQQGDKILKIGKEDFPRVQPEKLVEGIVLNDVREITVERNGEAQTITLPSDMANTMSENKVSKSLLMAPRTPSLLKNLLREKVRQKAGIKVGDQLIGINETPTFYYDEFTANIQKYKDKEVSIRLIRKQDTLQLPVQVSEQGTIGVFCKTDGYYNIEREMFGLAEAMPEGVVMGMDFLDKQLKAFGQMFRGKISVQDNLGSLISIGKLYGTSWDWERFWTLTASLSILLAFMNLLPIPALDGGYVLFLLWEVITGRKVSDSFMEKAVTVGFFLLLGLMVYALGLDLWRHVFSGLF
ncbi:MAG: RIP metalloprotease RseP [Saprospiraceae bacterium]